VAQAGAGLDTPITWPLWILADSEPEWSAQWRAAAGGARAGFNAQARACPACPQTAQGSPTLAQGLPV